MKNEEKVEKKSSRHLCHRWRYIIAAICFLFLITCVFTVAILRWELKPDPASEAIIRQVSAAQLNKDPNDLTDDDFAKIRMLSFIEKELSDINLLKKFQNLQELHLCGITFPKNAIPKWMKILAKLGIFNLNERFGLDLSPLEKISHLKILDLLATQPKNIEPLNNISNLQTLSLRSIQIRNLEPIRGLTNLQSLTLDIKDCSNIGLIRDLKNLQNLALNNMQVSDFESIKVLTNLEKLILTNIKVFDFEYIKGLTNLKTLVLHNTQVSNLEVYTSTHCQDRKLNDLR